MSKYTDDRPRCTALGRKLVTKLLLGAALLELMSDLVYEG